MGIDFVYSNFLSWLNGLIEDDPIPYEIKTLVFYVNINNEIGFSGTESENVKIIDLYFYYPLESEYFDFKPLYNYFYKRNFSSNQVLSYLKDLLIKLKKDKYFGRFNFYYGFLYKATKKLES